MTETITPVALDTIHSIVLTDLDISSGVGAKMDLELSIPIEPPTPMSVLYGQALTDTRYRAGRLLSAAIDKHEVGKDKLAYTKLQDLHDECVKVVCEAIDKHDETPSERLVFHISKLVVLYQLITGAELKASEGTLSLDFRDVYVTKLVY